MRAVRSRHFTTYLGVLTVIAALAVLTTGAGATSKCYPLNTTVYADPSGDGNGAGAPDITGITVTSWEGGRTTFEIKLEGQAEFTSDMVIRTFVDSDKSAATGNPKGFEYMIQAQGAATPDEGTDPGDETGGDTGTDPGTGTEWKMVTRHETPGEERPSEECEGDPGIGLYKWNGSGWAPVEAGSLSGSWGDGELSIELNSADMADAFAFNFAVYAASKVTFDEAGWPVLTNVAFDWAPDESTYSYQPLDYSAYNDPVGDGVGENALDITKVVVTRWRHKQVKFWITIPNSPQFNSDMLVRTYLDSDSDPATGDSRGFDFVIQAQRTSYQVGGDSMVRGLKPYDCSLRGLRGLKPHECAQPLMFLFKWQNSGWVPQDGVGFDFRYSNGLRFTIDPAELNGTKNFNFAVYAASKVSFAGSGHPSLANAANDWAPDTGTFGFPLGPENGQFIGTYKVDYKILSSHNFGNLKRGSRSTRMWKFNRSCKGHEGRRCVTQAATGDSRLKLARKGKAYKASAGRRFDCASGQSARGTEKLQLKAKKSRWIKGQWRVISWTGTVKAASPGNGAAACGGTASYTASLTGTLK